MSWELQWTLSTWCLHGLDEKSLQPESPSSLQSHPSSQPRPPRWTPSSTFSGLPRGKASEHSVTKSFQGPQTRKSVLLTSLTTSVQSDSALLSQGIRQVPQTTGLTQGKCSCPDQRSHPETRVSLSLSSCHPQPQGSPLLSPRFQSSREAQAPSDPICRTRPRGSPQPQVPCAQTTPGVSLVYLRCKIHQVSSQRPTSPCLPCPPGSLCKWHPHPAAPAGVLGHLLSIN